METPSEVATMLDDLSSRMREVADAMWRMHLGAECDRHSQELHGAARIAAQWAGELRVGQ